LAAAPGADFLFYTHLPAHAVVQQVMLHSNHGGNVAHLGGLEVVPLQGSFQVSRERRWRLLHGFCGLKHGALQ
jgi:hypothetical protein